MSDWNEKTEILLLCFDAGAFFYKYLLLALKSEKMCKIAGREITGW